MEKKQKIIFVDDEQFFSAPYVRELEKTYEVIYRKTAVTGLQCVLAHPEAKLLVLDIMMPSPKEPLDSKTENGLATGIWFLEEIRKIIIERPLPVVVLTNRILAAVEQGLADVAIPNGLLAVRAKIDTPRFYIPHLVAEMIEMPRPKKS